MLDLLNFNIDFLKILQSDINQLGLTSKSDLDKNRIYANALDIVPWSVAPVLKHPTNSVHA